MDKLKIRMRAWEPLEKRKEKDKNSALNWDFEKETKPEKGNGEKKRNYDIEIEDNHSLEERYAIKETEDDRVSRHALEFLKRQIDHREAEEYNDSFEDKQYHYEDYLRRRSRDKSNPRLGRYNIEVDERLNKGVRRKGKRRRASNPIVPAQVFKTIGAGFGAVATGLIFGYVLLNYFVHPMFEQETTIPKATNNSPIIPMTNSNIVDKDTQVIPIQTIYLLQAGVFSEKSGAQTILNEQKSAGRAAVIKGNGPYYVFVGMSTSKDKADKIKDLLVASGVDLYVKEYMISEYNGQMSKETFSEFSSLIISGGQIVDALAVQTADALINGNEKIEYDNIQKLHQQYLLHLQKVKSDLTSDGLMNEQAIVQKMSEQINYAIAALSGYKKTPNPQYLWNIQELLMKYQLAYEELVNI